jgi:predicted AAA+ superfamily ATPase
LNKLFSFLAYNAGNEASMENICQESGISKPTIRRYIEYLESAFLIIKVANVDDNCKSMKRERNFKIYLNNPSMRAALFGPITLNDSQMIGRLAESAVFSQWQHSPDFRNLRYARWRDGEVDMVYLQPAAQKPAWIGEIKWSDRISRGHDDEVKSLTALLRRHATIKDCFCTTRTFSGGKVLEGRDTWILPTSAYCYVLGQNISLFLHMWMGPKNAGPITEAYAE